MRKRSRATGGGFTLVELLVVMAIVIMLASFLIAALWPQKDKALRSNTSAMLQAISSALDQYYAEFHDFPPDGYDHEPGWAKTGSYPGSGPGILLGGGGAAKKKYLYYGSGCLIYFLCYPIVNVTVVGADQGGFDPRNLRVTPCNKGGAFLTTLKHENFSTWFRDPDNFDIAIHPGHPQYGTGALGPDEWAKGEIVDAYGYPIHYDKVGDVNDTIHFQAGTFLGSVHNSPYKGIHSDEQYVAGNLAGRIDTTADTELNACPSGNHGGGGSGSGGPKHADPRAVAEDDGCYIDPSTKGPPRPRNPGGYDLWAHGKCWGNGITAITNWK